VHYYIDGYNFLFRLSKKHFPLEKKRQEILIILNRLFKALKLKATIVFDSSDQSREYASRSHFDFLEVVYTTKNQSADDYILQEIHGCEFPKQKMVVSSDRELTGRCKQKGANVLSIEEFIEFIVKKKGKQKKSSSAQGIFQTSEEELNRLLTIFEDRLKNSSNE
jgi:predicted RNA-binding protein with PIN domain